MQEYRFAALWLSGICILVYVLSWLFPDLYGSFTLVSSLVWERPWTLVTSMFMHANVVHLVSNLFALSLFGSILERFIGWRKMLAIFFTAGIVSSIASALFYSATLGASGAIFGVIGALAALRPRFIAWVLGVPMYMIVAAALWASLDFIGVFNPDNVAHVAHLFGMGTGLAAGIWLRKIYPPPKRPKKEKIEISEESLREFEDKYMR